MKTVYVGVDAGGTNIKLYTKTCKQIITSSSIARREEFVCIVEKFIKESGIAFETVKVGIAYTGIGNKEQIFDSGKAFLKGLDKTAFKHFPVVFINDANAVAYAAKSDFPNSKCLLAITNGTGLGSGIIIGNQIFEGANGIAGSIHGFQVGTPDNIISVGEVCSGSAIKGEIEKGDYPEEAIVRKAAEYLGMCINSIIKIFNPDHIVFSGGAFKYEGYYETMVSFIQRTCSERYRIGLEMHLAEDLLYNGAIGALRYAQNDN
ncbi:MAG: ROK family protein [Clostridia bacterium]|nr:ROK family protein [Clostridia bacterium]